MSSKFLQSGAPIWYGGYDLVDDSRELSVLDLSRILAGTLLYTADRIMAPLLIIKARMTR